MLTNYNIPVIVVIIKVFENNGLKELIQQDCPKAKYVIRVQAESVILCDGYEIKPKNLDLLVNQTYEFISKGMKNAFIASQKINLNLKEKAALNFIELYRVDSIKQEILKI